MIIVKTFTSLEINHIKFDNKLHEVKNTIFGYLELRCGRESTILCVLKSIVRASGNQIK